VIRRKKKKKKKKRAQLRPAATTPTQHTPRQNSITSSYSKTAMMETLIPVIDTNGEANFCVREVKKQTTQTSTMESAEMVGETNVLPPPCCCSASSLDQERKSWLGHVTTYEPLKVCLDDDSSNEDGDEDMFDDDAFTFGDEDFQAIMSHEAMRRMSTRITQVPHSYGRPAAQSSSDISPQNPSFLPSNQSAPLLTNKVSDISADSSPATSSVSFTTRHHATYDTTVRLVVCSLKSTMYTL